MTITPTDFKTRYPEFDSVTDARVQFFIDDALLEIDEGRWGDLFDRGTAALTAHLLAVATTTEAANGKGGALGPVINKSVGDVSVGFGISLVSVQNREWYYSTPYGQDFWRLVQRVGAGAVAVTG